MKNFYYITLIALFVVLYLQVDYVNNLYKDYIFRVSADLEKVFQTSISRELSYRNYLMGSANDNQPWKERIYQKWSSDMTPHERDSILKQSQKGDTIYIDEAKQAGIGRTVEEVSRQLSQDRALSKGFLINLSVLDSLFTDSSLNNFQHSISLYGKSKTLIDSIGNIIQDNVKYDSGLMPIGTKGLQYIQLKVAIPRNAFIKHQLLTLTLSACFILVVIVCLLFQLIGIRNRNQLLLKREISINGLIHDLKTPLNNVITLLSWIKATEQDKERRSVVVNGQIGLKRLVNNIESLLIMAQKDKRKIILNPTNIDLPQITEWVKNDLSNIYHNKPHTIDIVNLLPSNATIVADAIHIESVIRNLIENALKYSDDNVYITATLKQDDKMVIVSIKDNGWGISKKYQKKLFTQFFQVPRNKPHKKGFGIGLAQSRMIIQEHKGRITVESVENQGSIFSFYLPLTQ